MRNTLIVFAGGGAGALARGLLLAWLAPGSAVLPAPVLLANVLGSFVLGVIFALGGEARLLSDEARLFLAVGVLGGFTTFSTFAWGTDLLIARGQAGPGLALVYVVTSVVGGVGAAGLGLRSGERLAGRRVHPSGKQRGLAALRKREPLLCAQDDLDTIEAEDRD